MNNDGWCGVSASSAGPTILCPTRLALPPAFSSGDEADRGNAFHAFARTTTVNPGAREQALLEVPEEWRHTAAGMNLDLALDGLRVVGCEKAYALDAKSMTVRYIGENIERDYNGVLERRGQPRLGKYEVPFTMDVEAFWNDTPVELDYKSGQSIGDPSEHWQRRICATGLMLFHDTPTAISRVAYIKDDGTIVPDGHEFSILDAEEFCETLVRTIDAVWEARRKLALGIMPAVYPSDDACKYCPAMVSCPYYTNFAKSMLGRLKAIESGPDLAALSGEDAIKVWEELKTAEKIVETSLKSLKKIAEQKPFGNGTHEVRPKMKSRTYFDDGAARGLIVTLMGRLGSSEEEIQGQLKKLHGKTEYPEFRKVKVA